MKAFHKSWVKNLMSWQLYKKGVAERKTEILELYKPQRAWLLPHHLILLNEPLAIKLHQQQFSTNQKFDYLCCNHVYLFIFIIEKGDWLGEFARQDSCVFWLTHILRRKQILLNQDECPWLTRYVSFKVPILCNTEDYYMAAAMQLGLHQTVLREHASVCPSCAQHECPSVRRKGPHATPGNLAGTHRLWCSQFALSWHPTCMT